MNNKFKKFGIWTVSVFAGLYLLFLISPVLLSPIANSYSQNIEDAVKSATGFDTKLEGISIVTAPNLSIGAKVKNVQLSVPASETPFFTGENVSLRASLLPLIIRRIQIANISAKSLDVNLVVKKDGNFQILDYLPENKNNQSAQSAALPDGFKLSNHLPNIRVKNYKLGFSDIVDGKSYYIQGEDFKVSDFILDKKVKVSSKGKIVLDKSVISNYDIKILNKIMPDVQLDDMVFPKTVEIKDTDTAVTEPLPLNFNIIDSFKALAKNDLHGDVSADVKVSGTMKNPDIKGNFKVDDMTVAVDGKQLPESYFDLHFKGNKTDIDSIFFTSLDENEKTQIIGNIHTGKKPSIDLTLRSNAKFNNIFNLVDSIAQSFGVNDFETLSATGGIDADFNINSDMKKVLSTGYLKVVPSKISYGLYNIVIDNINADIDFMNNNVNIRNFRFSILGHPLKLVGTIEQNADTDLNLSADNLSVKGLLAAAGQSALLKDNDIKDGVISLNAIIKGKLKNLTPDVKVTLNNLNILNKPSELTVNIPSAQIVMAKNNINIKNSYLLLNNSRIDVKGLVKDYTTDKMSMNITAGGNINAADILGMMPQEVRSMFPYKGSLPLSIQADGNAKSQNISVLITANPSNYLQFADIDLLRGRDTKIQANMNISGDNLTFANSGVYTGGNSIASLTGGVSKLTSSPKLNLAITIPNNVSFPIWGMGQSNITANGNINISGVPINPQLKGTVKLPDISIKDMDFALKNLTAHLNGSVLNGSATADEFKFGGIIANNISSKFSLKDYTTFYLTDMVGDAFNGKVNGNISYGINDTSIGVNLKGKGLNSTDAVYGAAGIKNALTGTLGFSAKLAMRGVTDKEIINSMKGNITFNIDEGRFMSIGKLENLVAAQNVSSNSILKAAVSSLSGLSTIQEADKYKSITGELNLANGTANISSIKVAGPLTAYYVHGSYYILPNSANLTILGRLDSKVVSCLGPLGELSVEKLLAYIPKFGTATANILKSMTSDPANENTALIPNLTSGSKTFKDFKVIFNGPVESSSSVRNFKWLSQCDTTPLDLKKDLQNAKDAVKTNITDRVENAKINAQNVKNNINNIIETQKNKAETIKKELEQAKEDRPQSSGNFKNLLKNAVKNSQTKMPEPSAPTSE